MGIPSSFELTGDVMRYEDGETIEVGDLVRLQNGDVATVVASPSTNQYSAEFPREHWEYLRVGVLVRTRAGALVMLEDPLEPGFLKREPSA